MGINRLSKEVCRQWASVSSCEQVAKNMFGDVNCVLQRAYIRRDATYHGCGVRTKQGDDRMGEISNNPLRHFIKIIIVRYDLCTERVPNTTLGQL